MLLGDLFGQMMNERPLQPNMQDESSYIHKNTTKTNACQSSSLRFSQSFSFEIVYAVCFLSVKTISASLFLFSLLLFCASYIMKAESYSSKGASDL